MKSQIIQLEPHDDIISTRDKLVAAQATRVILVWPERKRSILNRKLDLVRLQRHSAQLGVQLGLVTSQREVRLLAEEIGIPVFKSLRSAQTNRWRLDRRRSPKRKLTVEPARRTEIRQPRIKQEPGWSQKPLARLLLFGISLIAVLAVIVVILPSAEILVLPEQEMVEVNLTVRANPDLEQPLLAGELPIQTGTIIVEGRNFKTATGSIRIPEKPATGRIEFTNLTEEAVEVPAGTVVTTLESPGVRFMTTELIVVPARIGATKSAKIQAQVPGSSGNLASRKILAIEGPLGLRLRTENTIPTSQGSDRIAIAPTEADRDTLKNQLVSSLTKSAANELQERIPQDGVVTDFPLLTSLEFQRVVEEVYSPSPDQPADQIDLLLRLEFSYKYIQTSHLQAFAQPILNASTPEGYVPVPETTRIYHEQPSQIDDQEFITWDLTLRQHVQKDVLTNQIAWLSRGLPVRAAIAKLQTEQQFAEPPGIKVSPSWWPLMPFLHYRIHIIIGSRET
jgi:hypothetical protein